VAQSLAADGVEVWTDTRAIAVESADGERRLVAERADGKRHAQPFDRLLAATGRAPSTAGLGLETIGARTDRHGAVVVDERLRTTAPGVYAVGDVTGAMPFTHVAAYHARVAAPNAVFHLRRKVSYTAVPWATFTDPEVGRVGLTEEAARERWGDRTIVTEFDYDKLDRAIAAGQTRGFAKLVGDRRGRLVGATVAAPSGGELIAELAAWVGVGATIDDVSRQVHAYPTLAEGPARAADEYITRKLLSPRMRALARPVLGALRALERISGPT
jgi:pyruvate/2-oxoglutarate dehydrogenase complex dihydrolipoamide dehydrogenase (E3) component